MKQKKEFKIPTGRAYFCLFSGMNTKLGPWLENNWENVAHALVLGIIDFRYTPNFMQVSKSTTQRPYFEDFTNVLQKQFLLIINELPIWLWICGSKEAEI